MAQITPILDIHNHTIASGHAYSSVLEYVKCAKEKGLSLIAITDHAPAMPDTLGEFYFHNVVSVPKEIDGVSVMMGIELNVLDRSGKVDIDASLLEKLSPVIASFHTPCYTFSNDYMLENNGENEKKDEITDAILNLMDNPYLQILGHLGDPRFPFHIEKVVKKAVDTGVLIEMNNQSLVPGTFRYGSRDNMLEMLRLCKRENYPIVMGSDSHFATNVGEFTNTLKLLEEAEFPPELVVNTSVEYLHKMLEARRGRIKQQ